MRITSTLAIALLIIAAPCRGAAQGTSPATIANAQQTTNALQTLIKAFSGRWTLKVKFEPSKETPGGLETSGEESWHASPGGLMLTDEEVVTVGPQTVIVVGLLWRDPKTKELHAMDCSNQIPDTCDLKGALNDVVVHWNGSELTIDEKEVSQGKVMTSRVAWSDITSNSFMETGSLAPLGGSFQTIMTVHATRTDTK